MYTHSQRLGDHGDDEDLPWCYLDEDCLEPACLLALKLAIESRTFFGGGTSARLQRGPLVRAALATGDTTGALRIAAKFPRLGDHEAAIQRAWMAVKSPDFCRQIGKDPAALIEAGNIALVERFAPNGK